MRKAPSSNYFYSASLISSTRVEGSEDYIKEFWYLFAGMLR